ncbi:MAG TPA: hypothetical protein VM286_09760 [Candidatus Thermoplasmatota archaeon]|nr:hypothetical protein [Candidatus Thermoplasmatota archaeon]
MSARVLLLLALALAGCASKAHPGTNDAAAFSSSGQVPLGSGSATGAHAVDLPLTAGSEAEAGGDGTGNSQAGGGSPAGGSGGTGGGAAASTGSSTTTATTNTGATTQAGTGTATGLPTSLPTSVPTSLPTTSTTSAISTTSTSPAPTSTSTTTTAPPTSTPTSSTSTGPAPPAAPASVTHACAVTLTGLHGLAPIPAYVATCSPATFVSSTGASFTHATAQVTSSAALLPASALVQVKDASGNLRGSASGLGTFSIPIGSVPSGPSVQITAVATLAGVFTDYQATVTITLG